MTQIFICQAKGELLASSNESKNLRWISLENVRRILEENEKKFYPMHVNGIKKYIGL